MINFVHKLSNTMLACQENIARPEDVIQLMTFIEEQAEVNLREEKEEIYEALMDNNMEATNPAFDNVMRKLELL